MADEQPGVDVLGRVTTGLYIVTAENSGQKAGFLASWVCQAGFAPPSVSVGIKQDRPIMRQMGRGATFAVNLLGKDDNAIMKHFAKGFEIEEDPFKDFNVVRTDNGTPYLPDALGYMECELMRVLEPSTEHNLVVGRIVGGQMQKEGEPWVHIRKSGARY